MSQLRHKRIWVAGHRGLVGSAVCRVLRRDHPDADILTVSRGMLDLRNQSDTNDWLSDHRPDAIVMAAATVGGIGANNDYPSDFLYDNLAIATNVIHAAARLKIPKFLFLGSSCIYPRNAAQPIAPESLLSGPLEPTNQWYAIAKIAGLKLCQAYRAQGGHDFISAMPCNLYGPGDRFDADRSHVIPALMLKCDSARRAGADHVMLWGDGTPLREFLYADDLARALLILLDRYSGHDPVNVGSGAEISIAGLARMIADVTGFGGDIRWDSSRPNGTMRKIIDSTAMRAMGWIPDTELRGGLMSMWDWYCTQKGGRDEFRAA